MPSTFHSLHTHYIFSTKDRHPYFTEEIISDIHAYLGGIIRHLDAKPIMVGGVADHVHMLIGQKTTQCPADLVREIKKASTNWLQEKHRNFAWQEGYGAFTVSPERLSVISKYIENQPKHHEKKSFRDEWIEMLRYANIEFDESQFD